MLQRLSHGKGLTFDLVSDIFLSRQRLNKTAQIFRTLWSCDLNSIHDLHRHFVTRIITLNKAHPLVPTRFQLRPIVILSPIVKVLESRLVCKLKDYATYKLHPSQTGFVEGCGTMVNIVRLIQRVKSRAAKGIHCYAVFIDFKSAFNTIKHSTLFNRLNGILNIEEIQLLQAIYSRLILCIGKEKISPNLGVAQDSVLSPLQFNIYTEALLINLNKLGINNEDLFCYADDLVILCYSLQEIHEVIKLIRTWSLTNKLFLNNDKSGNP